MSKPDPRCPACRESMEEGFVLDQGDHNRSKVSQWVEGQPVKSFWTGLNIKDRQQHPITAIRIRIAHSIHEKKAPPGRGFYGVEETYFGASVFFAGFVDLLFDDFFVDLLDLAGLVPAFADSAFAGAAAGAAAGAWACTPTAKTEASSATMSFCLIIFVSPGL